MRYFLSPSLRPLPDFPSPLHSDLLSDLASLSSPFLHPQKLQRQSASFIEMRAQARREPLEVSEQ